MKSLIDYITEAKSSINNVFDELENILASSKYDTWHHALSTNQADIEKLAELVEGLPEADPDKDNYIAYIKYNYTPGGTKTNKIQVFFIDKTANFGKAGSSPIAITYSGLMFGTHNVIMKVDAKIENKRDCSFHKIDKDFVKNLMDQYNEEINDKREDK